MSVLGVQQGRLSPRKARSPYTLHPSVAYVQALLDTLEEGTGKSLAAWLRLLRPQGPKDERRRRDWLKAQGLGHGQASLVAERSMPAKPSGFDTTAAGYLASAMGYVERQYAGKKAPCAPCTSWRWRQASPPAPRPGPAPA